MFDSIGQWVAHWRRKRGLTQAQLAERLGCVQGAVGNYESGRNDVSRDTFVAIARSLSVPEDRWAEGMKLPTESTSRSEAVPQ